jgi:hypothetical protein
MAKKRVCGACTACCKTHGVSEIKKLPGYLCAHCTIGTGCNIYKSHPQSCKDFQCDWLKGFGRKGQRPDKTGVVLDFVIGEALRELFQMWEAIEGALGRRFTKIITRDILEANIFVAHLYLSGKRVLFIPRGKILHADTRKQLVEEGVEISSSFRF